ncbi:uncharacterized protein LOC125307902 [Alosa alosa]|uniref:uncharacterized protein LOC125307902 n=1 Tax=Alosa alosa TaxID=278164 RepID=UPI0020152718|nr:uncharacterized protein LOC125307902 [Alosa alosa]
MQVCAGVCLLLCLLCSDVVLAESNGVDINTLRKIIDYFQAKFSPGENKPYGVAINVHQDYCSSKFDSIQDRFLPNDTQQAVQKGLKKSFYKGQELMAAKTVAMKVQKLSVRAEYILLYPPNPSKSPLQVLLDRTEPDSCVVFYTLTAPCVRTCANVNGPYSLLPGLDLLTKYQGPKAFVFSQPWNGDEDASGSLKEIDQHVPLYRCTHQCVACRGSQGDDPINKECIN